MSGSSSPDYKALFFKAEEERKQAEERERQAEERERQERERNRLTTLGEFIRHCHNLLDAVWEDGSNGTSWPSTRWLHRSRGRWKPN